MKEKLIIDKFAGIDHIEMELGEITLLIGSQATGKSISAKCLFYLKSFVFDLFAGIGDQKSKKEVERSFLKKFEEYFPPQGWTPEFLIRHEIENLDTGETIFVQLEKQSDSNLKLKYSDFYKKEYTALREKYKKLISKGIDNENTDIDIFFRLQREYLGNFREKLGASSTHQQLFIPAGRSFFALLQSSIFSFLATNKVIDPFLKHFGSILETTKTYRSKLQVVSTQTKPKDSKDIKVLEAIDKIVDEILCGKYYLEKGVDYLHLPDGRRTSLSNSSSGQQESFPLTLILKNIHFGRFARRDGYTIYIEEPEAHLFPTAQKRVVELISIIYNAAIPKSPVQFFITTHSPYVLTSLNNLIQAGKMLNELKEQQRTELYSIIPEEQIIDPSVVKCYALVNGKCQSIMSAETGLITSEIIDDISDELSVEFGKLLNFG
jgi:predicted ATP-binding protein involved in virulence